MIISKTPLRVSFVGGSSDLPSFYEKHRGSVVSSTINKYIYVYVNKRFEDSYKVSYMNNEISDTLENIKHPIVRECIRYLEIEDYLEIISVSDLPGRSGLGSSSSFTVGLLNALHHYKGEKVSSEQLAKEACHIEMDVLKEPIGKQDQYAAAYGGLNLIEFTKKHVFIEPIHIDYCNLNRKFMLFYVGNHRNASTILNDIKDNMRNVETTIYNMAVNARLAYDQLKKEHYEQFAYIMRCGWNLKRNTGNISNTHVDHIIDTLITCNASSWKLCGAGQGGFILVYADEKYHDNIRENIHLKEVDIELTNEGSEIIYVD